ncbi:MAG: hypothetical protein IJR49_03755 [Treponema sp.]|nr:hypothetical protein [Treponema sp.]
MYLSFSFIALALIALVVFTIQKLRVEKPVQKVERELITNHELLVPDAPYVQSEYITSRQTKEKWEEGEIERWFTPPGENERNDLHHANNKTVSDILGAAP